MSAKKDEPNRFIAGAVFEFPYPFVRDKYSEQNEEGTSESPTWLPGTRFENASNGNTLTLADGVGSQTVTIVATFKPGRYPERIFFTRKWTDPDGKSFGKSLLKTKTRAAFSTLVRGYRHDFDVAGRPSRMDDYFGSLAQESPVIA
jgi:hypothetical protein